MSLGLSAVVAVIVLSPGILFWLGFARPIRKNVPPPDVPLPTSLLIAVLASAVMHWFAAFSLWPWTLVLPESGVFPDWHTALTLLAGETGDRLQDAITNLEQHSLKILTYFVGLWVSALVIGQAMSHAIRFGYRKDISRTGIDWYNVLTMPPGVIAVVATVDVMQDGHHYSYFGMLDSFEVSSDGTLERISFLESCARTNVDKGEIVDLENEKIVVNTLHACTVSVDYLYP